MAPLSEIIGRKVSVNILYRRVDSNIADLLLGVRTAMGIAVAGFPNMFFLYGPQAPTAFANGPSCTQYQADWVVAFLNHARTDGIVRIEAKKETENDWVKRVSDAWNVSLFPKAKSW